MATFLDVAWVMGYISIKPQLGEVTAYSMASLLRSQLKTLSKCGALVAEVQLSAILLRLRRLLCML